jgi:16S rRNA (uracil1498-N3)-methyltransferase
VHARFYAPDAEEPGQAVRLPGEEAEHLTRVLRLGPGDVIHVFNGRGAEFVARVASTERRTVVVTLGANADPGREPGVRVSLLQAVLKPDGMDTVVRDAVMMGSAAIQPVVTARSETTIAALERAGRQQRWMRIAVASAKQCGRATVPAVHAPVSFAQALSGIGTRFPVPALMFVEPGASPAAVPLHDLATGKDTHASIVIGPEGGWTSEEIASATAPVQLVTLRLPTVRASVMPLVALTALLATWEEI